MARELTRRLGKQEEVSCITSRLAPEERAARIAALEDSPTAGRVLVCTDCLSEGINLQEKFDAVIHYDLSWNPTRHEQRDGRVDRFGQKSREVRVLTYYGTDNQIDGIVLDVLLRKHRTIRNALGISVPMPVDSEQIVKAVFEGLLLRGRRGVQQSHQLTLFDDFLHSEREQLHNEWEKAADREKRSRTLFAQESIKFEEVASELAAAEKAIGSPKALEGFFRGALTLSGGTVSEGPVLDINLAGVRPGLVDALNGETSLRVSFEPVARRGVMLLHRTHPLVEGLAGHVLNSALDREVGGIATRAGVIRTRAVETRTVILLLRLRFHIVTTVREEERHLLAEDSLIAAFQGPPESPVWLEESAAEALLNAAPEGNIPPDVARNNMEPIISGITALMDPLEALAKKRGEELLDNHRRVRTAAGARGSYRIEHNPPDILGLYILLPVLKLV